MFTIHARQPRGKHLSPERNGRLTMAATWRGELGPETGVSDAQSNADALMMLVPRRCAVLQCGSLNWYRSLRTL